MKNKNFYSLKQIAKELLDDERRNDERYQKLYKIDELTVGTTNFNSSDDKYYNSRSKKYTIENYYSKIAGYTKNILQYNMKKLKNEHDDYAIPMKDAWLLKVFLKYYMNPAVKILRTKKLSEIDKNDWLQFIQAIENEILCQFANDEIEKHNQLLQLELHTNFRIRRSIINKINELEEIISNDLKHTQTVTNFQLRLDLLDEYIVSISNLSEEFRELVDESSLLIDKLVEKASEEEYLRSIQQTDLTQSIDSYNQDTAVVSIKWSEFNKSDVANLPLSAVEISTIKRKEDNFKQLIYPNN